MIQEPVTTDDLYRYAVDLFDRGYTKTDSDVPGVVRWWSIQDDGHQPVEVPLEVWFFIRGAIFGLGVAAERSHQKSTSTRVAP